MSLSNYDDYAWEDRDRERDYRDPYEHRSPPHSGMGIASCIIGGLVFVFGIGLLAVAGIMETSQPNGIDEESPEAMLLGGLLILNIIFALVGTVIGIVGAATPRRNKLFAGIGIGINSLVFLGLVTIIVIGIAVS